MKEFTLAYSPCPNDTFLFYHFVKTKISKNFSVKEYLMDVEELNQASEKSIYDITKLSFAAYLAVKDKYDLLNVGSALGRGCGPLILYNKNQPKKNLKNPIILSPGKKTTAMLLFFLYRDSKKIFPNCNILEVRYDFIIPKLQKGEGDFGIVIHEERFTYPERGMELWEDLGAWWEKETSLPIPLGCIAIRKDLSKDWKKEIEDCIQKSLDMAWSNPSITWDYILQHSQNKDPKVIQSHIELYVNQYTKNLGEEGYRAIEELFQRSKNLHHYFELTKS